MADQRNDQRGAGPGVTRREFLKAVGTASAGAFMGGTFLRLASAQATPIKIGYITPLTGFLGQIGEYGVMGARLAIDETNARGGVLGRKVEVITEDSPNPGVAVTKATKLIERDQVSALIGEISSASGLAISEISQRHKLLYMNTGWNSDEGRGARCQRYTFHVECNNTMFVKTIGRWLVRERKITRWYFLTADYAFGHDLYRVSSQFLKEHGGVNLGNDMVPTGTLDYSTYILKLRTVKPDLVFLNLAGADQTTFLKQYNEFGAPFELAGGVMDVAPFWAAGGGALSGVWQTEWYYKVTAPGSPEFTARFTKRYGKPPDNQAWQDYVAFKILFEAMEKAKTTNSRDLVRYLEGGARFDILKGRPGWFRDWDHQLVQPMYIVRVKEKGKMEDRWDIFEVLEEVPRKNESLELILPTKEENPCRLPSL